MVNRENVVVAVGANDFDLDITFCYSADIHMVEHRYVFAGEWSSSKTHGSTCHTVRTHRAFHLKLLHEKKI